MKGKRNKLETIKIKLKRGIILLSIGFLSLGVFMNSNYVTNYQDEAYAELKEKYGINIQEDPDVIECVESSISETNLELVRNLELTVDTDLRTKSNVSVEDLDKMLDGTKLSGLGSAFVQAEQKYGVNALYMMGLACLESAYGTSNFAVKRNNLYGWNAVDSNPNNASYFDSKEDATLYVAAKLKKNYLTKGGAYHEGYTARSVDVHYCTDKKHADKICEIVSNLIKKLD